MIVLLVEKGVSLVHRKQNRSDVWRARVQDESTLVVETGEPAALVRSETRLPTGREAERAFQLAWEAACREGFAAQQPPIPDGASKKQCKVLSRAVYKGEPVDADTFSEAWGGIWSQGAPAVITAAGLGRVDVVKALVSLGADINVCVEGSTVLGALWGSDAAERTPEIVQMGADPVMAAQGVLGPPVRGLQRAVESFEAGVEYSVVASAQEALAVAVERVEPWVDADHPWLSLARELLRGCPAAPEAPAESSASEAHPVVAAVQVAAPESRNAAARKAGASIVDGVMDELLAGLGDGERDALAASGADSLEEAFDNWAQGSVLDALGLEDGLEDLLDEDALEAFTEDMLHRALQRLENAVRKAA